MPFSYALRYWPIVAVATGMYLLESGWAAILLYHAGIYVAMSLTQTSWRQVGTGYRFLPATGLWLAGLIAAPATAILLPVFLGMSPEETRGALLGGLDRVGLAGNQFWLFVVYLCLPHPAIEELGWRELLFVDSKFPHLRDFEFASYHLLVMHFLFPGAWLFFLVCFVCLATMGWIWRLLRIHFGGLAVPTWFHAGGDLGAMLGVWWLIR